MLYFYLTWRDPAAYGTVRAATDAWLAGDASCEHMCSDWTRELSCCDGIYQPTFFFRWKRKGGGGGGGDRKRRSGGHVGRRVRHRAPW